MFTNYSKLIAITNRHLLAEGVTFEEQIQRILDLRPDAIILREKDLSAEEYKNLYERIFPIVSKTSTPLILHGFVDAARAIQKKAQAEGRPAPVRIHLPFPMLEELAKKDPDFIADAALVGTSVHSLEEAVRAEELGCNYLVAGNIYETDCKPGLPGKGLEFLREIVLAVDADVYAIGGVTRERLPEILSTGATGGCMMSGFMKA